MSLFIKAAHAATSAIIAFPGELCNSLLILAQFWNATAGGFLVYFI
jgi:hypothetical protein